MTNWVTPKPTLPPGFSPVVVQRRHFLGEEATGKGAVSVGVLVTARGVEPEPAGVVVVGAWRVGDEPARGVEVMVGGEGGGMAGEEGGYGDLGGSGAIGFIGGALDPDEVVAGVGDEEEGLRRGAQAQGHKVLVGAGGGPGDHWGLGLGGLHGCGGLRGVGSPIREPRLGIRKVYCEAKVARIGLTARRQLSPPLRTSPFGVKTEQNR
ncbi:hypothetical protein FH972_026331 [Carpinus fangiana]|uniref:Uncharacterized protein n=1 Tax=Carpinus fangiana TaxID=176857 RepID=A0A5N6L4M9_9ROSI|nr:hypothetical protein FH972_026331 [Carpinus fangiana]